MGGFCDVLKVQLSGKVINSLWCIEEGCSQVQITYPRVKEQSIWVGYGLQNHPICQKTVIVRSLCDFRDQRTDDGHVTCHGTKGHVTPDNFISQVEVM
jgi:hypothetical protein